MRAGNVSRTVHGAEQARLRAVEVSRGDGGDECLRLHVDMDQEDRLCYTYSPLGSTPRSRAGFSSAIMSEVEPLGLLFRAFIACPEDN